ncbi:MAG TPA: response regulator [Verrucomicrobiae bacterium]|nr:response regulator [Verrucomicrobiae bacterium]
MAEEERPVQFVHRVLVVEDDYQLADLLSEVLTYENCSAEVASNGMEAMEKLRGADFDAVICDLMMPRVDGEALYNQTTQQYPHLSDRFLFITGNAALRGGLTDFVYRTGNSLLEKPFEIEQLRAALKETFQR